MADPTPTDIAMAAFVSPDLVTRMTLAGVDLTDAPNYMFRSTPSHPWRVPNQLRPNYLLRREFQLGFDGVLPALDLGDLATAIARFAPHLTLSVYQSSGVWRATILSWAHPDIQILAPDHRGYPSPIRAAEAAVTVWLDIHDAPNVDG